MASESKLPFSCNHPGCNASFSGPAGIKRHARTHTNERPFQCLICFRRFKQRGTLKGHLTVHSDVREFKCEKCGQEFKQKSSMKRHFSKCNGVQNPQYHKQTYYPPPNTDMDFYHQQAQQLSRDLMSRGVPRPTPTYPSRSSLTPQAPGGNATPLYIPTPLRSEKKQQGPK